MTITDTTQADLRKLEILLLLARARSGILSSATSGLKAMVEIMSAEVDRIEAEVRATATVIDSGIVLLGSLAERLRAVAGDAVKVNALADELEAKKVQLAGAIEANTVP